MSDVPELNIPMDVLILAQVPKMLSGEEIDLTPIISMIINQKIISTLMASVPIPSEFEGIVNLMLLVEQMKAITAALRGEEYTPNLGQIVNMIVTFSLINALTQAFG